MQTAIVIVMNLFRTISTYMSLPDQFRPPIQLFQPPNLPAITPTLKPSRYTENAIGSRARP